MAKNLKIKIKNTQLAKAAGLDKLKKKLAGEDISSKKKKAKDPKAKEVVEKAVEEPQPEKKRIKAKSRSAFAVQEEPLEELQEESQEEQEEPQEELVVEETPPPIEEIIEEEPVVEEVVEEPLSTPVAEETPKVEEAPPAQPTVELKKEEKPKPKAPVRPRLGPTGRHVKDLLQQPTKKEAKPAPKTKDEQRSGFKAPPKPETADARKKRKAHEFKDLKPYKRQARSFDSRDRMGLSAGEEQRWRKKRIARASKLKVEEPVIRPSKLSVRLPVSVKDLASELKLKASELISKLFMQGLVVTLNDVLDDETVVQLLGHEFECEITIDTSEEERIRITDLSIQEEVANADPKKLTLRPPVVTFMGHVDHGKTSLIDKIRESDIASGEAGAITQHIGAFKCKTAVGEITILDTPGHAAFSAMRARGALVTDIVVLVIAGDEGIKEQTVEAILHAKEAGVTIVVAINKSDKSGFNPENVYRALSENNLLPEAWGGQTLTVNTSAISGEGISTLLETLALQAEVLELKADPHSRARGVVIESQMHKGMGSCSTILVQNGTLRTGDAIVFAELWGRVKTMRDEHSKNLKEAGPSTPVEITGLSGIPQAGNPFIVVKNEKEAKEIAAARATGQRQKTLVKKKVPTLEALIAQEGAALKKTLKLIIRGDVIGSVEALKNSLLKIESDKADLDIIFTGVGEISESDVQLAAASDALILGFHTQVESNAATLVKELKVKVVLHNIIYHAITDVKDRMQGLLDRIEEEKDTGQANVKTIFKSSGLGVIAGCQVATGIISRNHKMRVVRNGEVIWQGSIASIKRVQEDVKEVKKGVECGILLDGFNGIEEGDILQAFEIIYLTQEL